MSSTDESAPARDRRGLLGLRPNRSALLAGVLTLALGLAISAQINQTRDLGLESLREDELVSVLDTVTQRSARLDQEARELEAERARLAGGSAEDALARARERVGDLAILAGTAPAEGPGVTVTISGGEGVVAASGLLDLVQELRDAGAEAIQIGDVRVVASTAFQDRDGAILVDKSPISWPLRTVAIGDARTLASALAIPGGVEESFRGRGATIRVDPADRVVVNALHAPSEPRYARAVSPDEGHATP
ncbi:DUF881 domain-containing protein [Mobilicoccus caccae]|uniref:Membrane protein n=1 Tax=Mobilicoccus caccae TaxID=1859295 RepID=A0ABQ6ISI3_9MICO|nr:DUF881 domain-containing protein [Mobilicoccus caccae]GMA39633.1 membrane protein [Mobilicoccus caccae]